jgi:hypothetical protein
MTAELGIAPVATEIRDDDANVARTSWTSRLLALLCLLGVAAGTAFVASLAHSAFSDGWVAPLRLSPDNERVVDLRIQQTKEKADRARLSAEVVGIDEELRAVDVSLRRMQSLSADYRGALVWTADAQSKELRDLAEQSNAQLSKWQMLNKLLGEQRAVLTRADADRAAGLITSTEFDRQAIAVHQLEVEQQDSEIELGKIEAARSDANARGQALTSASSGPGDPSHHRPSQLSPDVIKFYDDQVRVELEVARLEAEKRSAQARREAAQGALDDMGQLLSELESRPLYRAMQQNTDVAFAPYDHLRRFGVGDEVYACTFSIFACRVVGTVTEVVSGEVITQDPWGELARGQYVILEMRDRTALFERVLRVRHANGPTPATTTSSAAALVLRTH